MVLLTFAFSMYAQPSSAHAAANTGQTSATATHAQHPNASIGQVPCTQQDFMHVYNNWVGPICYANPGFMGVNLPNTRYFYSGNNYGWVKCYSTTVTACNYGGRVKFDARTYFTPVAPVLITQICLGPTCKL